MPARSNASQEVSRSSRCCGSIAKASRGEIPKSAGSKSATRSRKAPLREYDVPTPAPSGSYSDSTSQPRSVGKSVTASTPDRSTCHRSSGLDTPPGNRHDIATIAIGSSLTPAAAAAAVGVAAAAPDSSVRR